MTLIRKLASALYLALLCSSYSNAQVDPTTGNLINFTGTPTSTTSNWNNVGQFGGSLTCWRGGDPGYCGSQPRVNANGYGVINFSYGQTDLNQIVNINRALEAGGTGVQLSGFNFGFRAKNGNGWDNGAQDYLGAYVKFYDAAGGVAATYDYTSQTNRKYNWTNFNFSETFANPVAASNYSNAQVGFVGRDNNFWVGPYGPEIYNVSFSLKYRVDPCSTNPAYSPSCAGFNNIITSNNILPQPDAWGTSMNQIVAINTALKNGGIGATVHGFNYGFDYTVGQSWFGCTATNQDGSCSWYMNVPAQVSATAQLTKSNNQSLYSKNHTLTGDGTSGSVSGQYLLPSSLNQTSLGNVRLYGNASGTGSSIGNFSASLIYTADPCVSNPLYNASCNGYAVAYAKNMLLGSTVASATGTTSSGSSGNSMSSNAGQVEQNQGNTQSDQTQQTQQGQQTQQQSSPGPQQESNQNPSVAQDNPSQPSPQQAGPASTTPQPAGGPPQTATASASSSSGPGGGGSAGPSKLAMSVLKTAQANDKATQASAVQNAAKALENASQSSQASSNLAISLNQDMSANSATAAATFASQQTQTSQQTTTQTTQQQQTTQTSQQTQQASRSGPQVQQQQQDTQQAQVQSSGQVQVQAAQQQDTQQVQTQSSTSVVKLLQPQQQDTQQTQSQTTAGMMTMPQSTYTPPQQQAQDTQSTQVAILKPPTPAVIEVQQQSSSGTGLTVSRNLFAYNPLMSSNTANMSLPLPTPQPNYQPKLDTRQTEVETPQMPVASFSGSRAGNPLSEIIMQQRFEMMQNNIAAPTSSVNRNVQPNELAGKIDIAAMATTPAGFNAYSIILKDAAFYEPKEVYKNQRTVDNERVLRGLTRGSDAKHQEMIDQQYKLGN
jgi:hypothetical protein